MTASFTLHSTESAPDSSRSLLDKVSKSRGSVPNILKIMAASPATLEAYLTLSALFGAKVQFSPIEAHVVMQTINRANDCKYYMAAHSKMAVGKQGVPAEIDRELCSGKPLSNRRLEALRAFTYAMTIKRGWIHKSHLDSFFAAGFTSTSALEVILAIGLKTISNYTNHIAATPVEERFTSQLDELGMMPAAAE